MSSRVCPTHNTQCRRLVVGKAGPNKGRTFFVCQQSGCKYFEWETPQDAPSQTFDPTQPSQDTQPPQPQDTQLPQPAQDNQPPKPPVQCQPLHTTAAQQAPTHTSNEQLDKPNTLQPTPEKKKTVKLSLFKNNTTQDKKTNDPTSKSPVSHSSNLPSIPPLHSHSDSSLNSSEKKNHDLHANATNYDDPLKPPLSPPSSPPPTSPLKRSVPSDSSNHFSSNSINPAKPVNPSARPTTKSFTNLFAKSTTSKIKTESQANIPKDSDNKSSKLDFHAVNSHQTNPTIPLASSAPPIPTTSATANTGGIKQSPKKPIPLEEMQRNSAVLASPAKSSAPNKIIGPDAGADSSDDFQTPPKNIKSLNRNTTTTTTSTTTTTTTTTSAPPKAKKMLSLEILNGKANKTKDTKDVPAKPIRPPGKEQLLEKVVVDLQVVTTEHVGLTKKVKNQEVEEAFRSIPGSKLDTSDYLWTFPIGQYNTLVQKMRQLGVTTKLIPKDVMTALQAAKARDAAAANNATNDFSDVPPTLFSGLLGFQIDGLLFAARNGGRCLIADEMGLGKTIQALAIAACYKSEWPLLIICPSSVRPSWKIEIEKWLEIHDPKVKVINSGKENLSAFVNIISYDLAVRAEEEIRARKFKVIICDESHYLKSLDAERTKVLVPIIKSTPRAILLTGTPALSRPAELFPQLQALGKQMFKTFKEYALRYCAAYKGHHGWDYSGHAHLAELHVILSQTVMIRRLKADVLSDLPGKTRSTVSLDIPEEDAETMRGDLAEARRLGALAKQAKNKWAESDKKQLITQLYRETARAKQESVCNYVLELATADPTRKFLVFAHHKEMMDAVESALSSRRITCMRIDGATPPSARSDNVHHFQTFKNPQVAVLSMTAAGTGLTLNKAALVVFAELYWTPGVLRQCEDRVHRIGQTQDCDIRYLVAKNTLDETIWPLIRHKLEVVGETLDGQGELLETTEMDYIQGGVGGGGDLFNDPIDDDDILTAVLPDADVSSGTSRRYVPPPPITPPSSPDIGSKPKGKGKRKTATKEKGKENRKRKVADGDDDGLGGMQNDNGKKKRAKRKESKKSSDFGDEHDDIPQPKKAARNRKRPTDKGKFKKSLKVGDSEDDATESDRDWDDWRKKQNEGKGNTKNATKPNNNNNNNNKDNNGVGLAGFMAKLRGSNDGGLSNNTQAYGGVEQIEDSDGELPSRKFVRRARF